MPATIDFQVKAPAVDQHQSFVATVFIPVTPETPATRILDYMRSVQMKLDLINGWGRKEAPNYGLSTRGGPRPILKNPKDRSSTVMAYEQDFQFTKTI